MQSLKAGAVSGTNNMHWDRLIFFSPSSLWLASLLMWMRLKAPSATPCLSVKFKSTLIICVLLCPLSSLPHHPPLTPSLNCHSTLLLSGDAKGPADAPIVSNKLYVVSYATQLPTGKDFNLCFGRTLGNKGSSKFNSPSAIAFESYVQAKVNDEKYRGGKWVTHRKRQNRETGATWWKERLSKVNKQESGSY